MLSKSRNQSPSQNDPMPLEINELLQRVASLPEQYRDQIEPSLHRVVEMTKRRRRILSLVQEALGQLRLDMKYLMFDLDATRRERDALRDLDREN